MYLLLNSGNICIFSFYLQFLKHDSCNTVMKVLLHTSPYKIYIYIYIYIYMKKVNKEIKFKGVIDCDFSFLTSVSV